MNLSYLLFLFIHSFSADNPAEAQRIQVNRLSSGVDEFEVLNDDGKGLCTESKTVEEFCVERGAISVQNTISCLDFKEKVHCRCISSKPTFLRQKGKCVNNRNVTRHFHRGSKSVCKFHLGVENGHHPPNCHESFISTLSTNISNAGSYSLCTKEPTQELSSCKVNPRILSYSKAGRWRELWRLNPRGDLASIEDNALSLENIFDMLISNVSRYSGLILSFQATCLARSSLDVRLRGFPPPEQVSSCVLFKVGGSRIWSLQPHQTNLTPSKEITRNLTITIIQLATTQQSYVSQSSVTDLVTAEAEMNSVNDSPNLRYMILLCAGVTSLLVVLLCLTGFVLFIKPNPPLDSGLFQAENGKWKRIRTTVAPTFTASKLKEIVPIIDDASQKLMAKMEKFAETGESVDVNRLFSLFALEVIMKAAFGFDSDVQMNPDPEFVEKANNVFKTPVVIRVFSLFPFWTYFSRYFSILQNVEYFISIAKEMLQKRAKKGPTAKKDLVELMMEAQENIVDGVSKLNDDEIMAQSITFLVAGFETTGSTLTSTAYLLATSPAVQDKLIEEIDKAEVEMARNNSSLYDHVQKLGYLDQVISEVLRLCSPAFNLVRGCEEEVVYKGIRFPKGVEVNIPSYVLHRDPEVWKNPLQFNPENFSPEAKEKRNPYSFIPFGTGPRHCLGMRFALLEIKVALLKILQRFKFECAPETVATLEHRAVILMAPKDMIYLKIKAR